MLKRALAAAVVAATTVVVAAHAQPAPGTGSGSGSGSAAPPPAAPPTTGTADRTVVEPAPPAPKSDDDEGEVKFSLPTEADRVAWTKPGFRLSLGMVYGHMYGLRGAPSGRLLGPELHAGLRLDKDWSIYVSFQYASASENKGLSALRFAGTVDPTWHVTPALALAIGFGFAGLVEGRTGRADPDPLGTSIQTSYTYGSSEHPRPRCSGVGAAGLLRATYGWVMGPRATFNLEAELFGQYTACVDRTGVVEPDTAQAIIREQYWPHLGFWFGGGFTWR
jgi:hypothetical protein